jgi:branched-chain amino acid transport system substrate-binding protein
MIGAALLPTATWAQTSATPIKIGAILALSGPAASYGAAERRGIEAVVAKVNAEGGIGGRKIEAVIRDSKTNPTEAARVANQMIADDGVVAIVGGTTTSETMAFAEPAMRAKVPLLPLIGAQSVTDPKYPAFKWVFRMSVGLATDLTMSMERLVKDGHKRIVLFYQEDAYGEQAAGIVKEFAKTNGVEIADTVSAGAATTDLTTQATRIRAAKPTAIFMATSFTGLGGGIVRKLDQLGVNVPAYSLVAIVQRQFIETAGRGAEMLIAPALVNPDEVGPLQPLFDLMKDHGGVDGFGPLLGANATIAIVEALKKGATDGDSIRNTLETMGPIKGYGAGPIVYTATDHDGWKKDIIFFVTVKDGKFKNL